MSANEIEDKFKTTPSKPGSGPYQRLAQEGDAVKSKPSIILPHLQESEKKFFELVASGKC